MQWRQVKDWVPSIVQWLRRSEKNCPSRSQRKDRSYQAIDIIIPEYPRQTRFVSMQSEGVPPSRSLDKTGTKTWRWAEIRMSITVTYSETFCWSFLSIRHFEWVLKMHEQRDYVYSVAEGNAEQGRSSLHNFFAVKNNRQTNGAERRGPWDSEQILR